MAKIDPSKVKQGAREAGMDTAAGFFREVDDMIQEERLRSLWRRWRWVIIGSVLVLVAGTAGQQGWKAWQRHQAQAVAEQWYTLSKLTPDDETYAVKLAAMREVGANGYRALALFADAERLEKEDTAESRKKAATLYAQVSADTLLPQWLRDLAELNTAVVLMGVDDKVAKTRLENLTENSDSAVYASALELLALAMLREGDTPKARSLTEQLLAVKDLPPDMRERAFKRLGSLSTLAR